MLFVDGNGNVKWLGGYSPRALTEAEAEGLYMAMYAMQRSLDNYYNVLMDAPAYYAEAIGVLDRAHAVDDLLRDFLTYDIHKYARERDSGGRILEGSRWLRNNQTHGMRVAVTGDVIRIPTNPDGTVSGVITIEGGALLEWRGCEAIAPMSQWKQTKGRLRSREERDRRLHEERLAGQRVSLTLNAASEWAQRVVIASKWQLPHDFGVNGFGET